MQPIELIHKLLDDTYKPVSKTGTYSLKHSMHGNRLTLNYSSIVHFASEKSLRPQVEVAKDQARQLIKSKIDRLKKDFKEAADATLKFKDQGEDDNIEVSQSTSNSPRKVAYYRYTQTISFDD